VERHGHGFSAQPRLNRAGYASDIFAREMVKALSSIG
jgi:hypothetical protein